MFPFLPSKKYIGSSLSADFVDKRQRDLGYYMMSILHSCPLVGALKFAVLTALQLSSAFCCLQLVQDEIIDSFLDIKRHILERAREESLEQRSNSTPTHAGTSSNGGISPCDCNYNLPKANDKTLRNRSKYPSGHLTSK